MLGLSKQNALASLRARIETIEKRPLLGARVGLADVRGGIGQGIGLGRNSAQGFAQREAGLPATPPGLLHEVFSDQERDAGAALGFALGLARQLASPQRPALLYLQLSRDGQALGLPYGAGLRSFGLDPYSVVIGRMETPIDLLWAMEEAIACHAVGAVVADIAHDLAALDFTASRRLSLRAASAGCSAFIVRYGRQREASAARLRWRVSPALSAARPFDGRSPGRPRWRVDLERGRLEARGEGQWGAQGDWILDWTEHGFASGRPHQPDGDPLFTGAALSGAQFAALGDRLSQTG